jgi:hypothetical protein
MDRHQSAVKPWSPTFSSGICVSSPIQFRCSEIIFTFAKYKGSECRHVAKAGGFSGYLRNGWFHPTGRSNHPKVVSPVRGAANFEG